jgi:6-phospho-beta-glucosidase
VTGTPATIVLDIANRGAVPFLDDTAVVEVPCVVDSTGVQPQISSAWTLHEQGLVSLVKDAERMTIAASAAGSRALALRALALHPLVSSVQAAAALLDRYCSAFPELAARLQ